MEISRRKMLSGIVGATGTGMLAGCVGGDSNSDSGAGETNAQASFFVFGDLTAHVTEGITESGSLVPVGQHGHGWSPGPSIREDIRTADLFIHGMTNFQPWVDAIRSDLDADGADVTTMDISAGLNLLEAGGGGHNHGDGEHNEENGHDGEHNEENGHDGEHNEENGHDGEHNEEDNKEDGHNGHDHGSGMDPHFWMDPLRVKEAVDNVSRGLTDVDPDNEEMYTDNAAAFQSDLDELHEQIESMVSDASKNVILLAGHNAFQYFGDRYDIEVAALTDVSPDDRPTLQDIKQAQEVIETHDLQYICADPIESQQAAQQLVEETDANEVLPLTAMPGLTENWENEDWGYIEIMKNVNLPTLEKVLDA
ncbi:metal ABC transporter substrate-binding protein [Halovenus rubra]|uniref:Metal ABC transporter substrate-binding protein n=1 Tax=Halovenus rubra TaxID=869890 RepID=A0ABD5X2A8_9EURY